MNTHAFFRLPMLCRIRNFCPSCGGNGRLGAAESPLCFTCGGYGYIDESDADFRARVLATIDDAERMSAKDLQKRGDEARATWLYWQMQDAIEKLLRDHAATPIYYNPDTGFGFPGHTKTTEADYHARMQRDGFPGDEL